jgi:hypothetical protein
MCLEKAKGPVRHAEFCVRARVIGRAIGKV